MCAREASLSLPGGVPLERDGVWGTLVAEAELGARARAGGPRVGGGQDGTQEPPG